MGAGANEKTFPDWDKASKEYNSGIVQPEVVAQIYMKSQAESIFSTLGGGRVIAESVDGSNNVTIGSGKDSPIFEKTLSQNNTAIFTMEEELEGMPTYGDASVRPGNAPNYMHAQIQARSIWSPAYPIHGYELQDNMKRVIPLNTHVARRKNSMGVWAGREMDLDGMRASLYGLSRGLYLDTDGGKGTELYGTDAATRYRVPFHTFVPSGTATDTRLDKVSNAVSAQTHNENLRSRLVDLNSAVGTYNTKFTFDTHRGISEIVRKLRLRPITLNGQKLRAVVLMDPRNFHSLRKDPELVELWTHATPRDMKNFAIYSRQAIELDEILYLPKELVSWFRPVVTTTGNSGVRFGVGFDVDPRSEGFEESVGSGSNLTMSIVMGAGALRRGRRKFDMSFKEHNAPFDKGKEIAMTWDDGWMRNEWYAKDGRDKVYCDSSFVVFNKDEGRYAVNI